MFQFRRFPSYTYGFSVGYLAVGFPIRKSPDRSLFAAPRSLSQLITSFIGSWCQGIPLALLLAWLRRNQHPFHSVSAQSIRSGRKLRSSSLFLLSNQNPLALGFWFVFETRSKVSLCDFKSNHFRKVHNWFSFNGRIMQAHVLEVSFWLNCNLP